MLVINGYKSHMSAEFHNFHKDHKIITNSLPPHSSHRIQPLDVGYFNPLKTAYGEEIKTFVKSYITHITKTEFLIAF